MSKPLTNIKEKSFAKSEKIRNFTSENDEPSALACGFKPIPILSGDAAVRFLERAKQVIDEVAKQTDEIILFHSLSGKDSITLLDLVYPKFKRVVCVFMYIVKGLDHIDEYYRYAMMKYPKVR